ncbi:MAG: (2Fe-2S) ferredoxin domain-containing protein [Rubrobacteraceae bacterium]
MAEQRAEDTETRPLERGDPALSGGVDAVLLLGRSGHQGAAGEGMESLAEAVRATGRYLTVHTAIVERGLASLPEGLEACAQVGVRKVLVIPVFFGRDRSLVHWLSKVAFRWSRARGNSAPEVIFTGAIGEHPALGEAVVRAVADAEGEAPVGIDDFESLEDPPAWSMIPPQERHVLACMGPRCTSRGAGKLYVHLWKRLQKRGLLQGRSGVHAAQTGCLSPCNLGPTMIVYPEGIWYCGLTAEAIDRIVDEHFVGGRVVEEYARGPGRHERPAPPGR